MSIEVIRQRQGGILVEGLELVRSDGATLHVADVAGDEAWEGQAWSWVLEKAARAMRESWS